MKKALFLLLFLTFFVEFNVNLVAQDKSPIGVILTAQEANALFGPPIRSFSINKKVLTILANICGDKIGFNLVDNKLVIITHNKKVLFPPGYVLNENQQFYGFSLSKVIELMGLNNASIVNVEIRANNVLTVAVYNGNGKPDGDGSVLEFSKWGCPPYCDQ